MDFHVANPYAQSSTWESAGTISSILILSNLANMAKPLSKIWEMFLACLIVMHLPLLLTWTQRPVQKASI